MVDGEQIKAMAASLAGPTCPVCWPGLPISRELAAEHREWHALRDEHLRAHAVANQTGELGALNAARYRLAEFEVAHPHLTPSGGT